ncbi:MIP/aquaporin family protein [Streptomyces sp. NPDC005181]|uniref:MIP/aquaporin family protein n=1 Tax=Streptomyces sp. NPDC005181 TaxID=3156869 RepID=UPI0033BA13D6
MSTVPSLPHRLSLARAADEFVLATVLLFLAVTAVRWLRDPDSALYVADRDAAIAVIGAFSGAILTALILTPPGRRSGGHMNPAVTVSLWLMGAFPGRSVLPYVLAQLAGSAAGTGLARLVWGRPVSLPSVDYAAIMPAPTWQPASVFLAETGSMAAIVLVVGFLLTHTRFTRLLPYAIGLSVALVIALLGTRSGGSINPARQLGPAALAGQTKDLWIYLVAPVLGAAIGAWLDHVLGRRRLMAAEGRAQVSAVAEQSRVWGPWSEFTQVRHRDGHRVERAAVRGVGVQAGRPGPVGGVGDRQGIVPWTAQGTVAESLATELPLPGRPPIGVEMRDTQLRSIWVNDIQGFKDSVPLPRRPSRRLTEAAPGTEADGRW